MIRWQKKWKTIHCSFNGWIESHTILTNPSNQSIHPSMYAPPLLQTASGDGRFSLRSSVGVRRRTVSVTTPTCAMLTGSRRIEWKVSSPPRPSNTSTCCSRRIMKYHSTTTPSTQRRTQHGTSSSWRRCAKDGCEGGVNTLVSSRLFIRRGAGEEEEATCNVYLRRRKEKNNVDTFFDTFSFSRYRPQRVVARLLSQPTRRMLPCHHPCHHHNTSPTPALLALPALLENSLQRLG